MLIWNCILPEIFRKISTQAKRNYTFKRIYLLLRMSAFIPRRLQRLACNECLKNPWCSISETFIAAVIVLITASAIPETVIFFHWRLFDHLKFLIFVEGSGRNFLPPRINQSE